MSILFRRLLLLAAVALGLAGLATTAWFYVRNEVDSGLSAFMAQEAAKGRDWTCDKRSFDGYPFAMVLRCDAPSMVTTTTELVRLSVARLQAEASVFSFGKMRVTLTGPMEARLTRNRTITSDWRSLTMDLARTSALLKVEDLTARLKEGSAPEESLRANRLFLSAAPTTDRVAAAHAWDIHLDAGDVDWDRLHALTTNKEPLSLRLAAIITGLDAQRLDQPLPEVLDAWRQAGGNLRLSNVTLTKGDLRAGMSGELRIDDLRRPAGDIELWASSLEPLQPLLKSLRIGANVAAMTSVLRVLGGGAQAEPESGSDARRIRLPLGLANGRVRLGAIATPVRLAPLY